jgi:hypothetical protein
MSNAEIPWYHRWLLDLPRSYWPDWLKRAKPAKTLEIKLWHRDRYNAARVMAEYAKTAFTEAWGHKYEVEVTVRRRSIPSMSDDEAFGYVRDHQSSAKDVNALCLPHTDAVGGGSTCKFSVDTPWDKHPDVGDLWVTPNTGKEDMEIKEFACGPPFGQISSGLHEMGHCVGLGHNIGGTIVHNGKRHATPMPYVDSDCYYLRYSEEARGYSIDVE